MSKPLLAIYGGLLAGLSFWAGQQYQRPVSSACTDPSWSATLPTCCDYGKLPPAVAKLAGPHRPDQTVEWWGKGYDDEHPSNVHIVDPRTVPSAIKAEDAKPFMVTQAQLANGPVEVENDNPDGSIHSLVDVEGAKPALLPKICGPDHNLQCVAAMSHPAAGHPYGKVLGPDGHHCAWVRKVKASDVDLAQPVYGKQIQYVWWMEALPPTKVYYIALSEQGAIDYAAAHWGCK